MGLIIKDGVIYNGAESEPVVYSLDEREIGVWIDGKPLYEKTYTNATEQEVAYQAWTTTEISANDIDIIVNLFATRNADGGTYIPVVTRKENGYVQIFSAVGWKYNNITILYTKSTDTPGSGTWTPSGAKAEHYSTNEHVVGTWVDGSTVYERTDMYQTESVINSGDWRNTQSNGTGIANIIDCVCYSNNGASFRFVGARNRSNTIQILSPQTFGMYGLTFRYTKTTS